MHHYITLFLRALVFTVGIETVVLILFFFLRRSRVQFPGMLARVCVAGVVASSVTLPFVWFVFPLIIEHRSAFLVAAELFAFLAEIPMIRSIVKTTLPEAAVASLAANGASFMAGLLIGMS
jgi:hypothetical protein